MMSTINGGHYQTISTSVSAGTPDAYGEPELCARYRRALDRLGAASKFIDGSELILAGFIAARPNIADVLL